MKFYQNLAALGRRNLDIAELETFEAVPGILINRIAPCFCDRWDARHIGKDEYESMGTVDSDCKSEARPSIYARLPV
jgi:hypothetical protein